MSGIAFPDQLSFGRLRPMKKLLWAPVAEGR